MPDEAAAVEVPLHLRVRAGLRQPANWLQLVRFAAVGAAGSLVNLAVFALAVHAAGIEYQLAAVLAFLVAVSHNFLWNRRWTFGAHAGRKTFQAPRFLAVSIAAFLVSIVVLTALVDGLGVGKVLAQAMAIATAMPIGFLGNKLWSFGRP